MYLSLSNEISMISVKIMRLKLTIYISLIFLKKEVGFYFKLLNLKVEFCYDAVKTYRFGVQIFVRDQRLRLRLLVRLLL